MTTNKCVNKNNQLNQPKQKENKANQHCCSWSLFFCLWLERSKYQHREMNDRQEEMEEIENALEMLF